MLQPSLRTRLMAFDHRTLDEALSAACRQRGEMEQYLEEKKASQKRPAATFQRQDKKQTVYQTPQRSIAVGSSQVPSVRSPGVKKECPHCGKTHGGTECWMITGKCLKCGSSDHKIKDCPRLQQGAQRGAPAPATSSRSPYCRQYHDVDVVSASTPWTPTLIPASNDVDANFSDLHALQSPEFWEQATPTIGELSPTGRYRHPVENCKTGLLGEASSVDTIWSSVDTLSRPVDRVLWELGLVSTLLDLVSTPLDHFFIFCLRTWSIVSTPEDVVKRFEREVYKVHLGALVLHPQPEAGPHVQESGVSQEVDPFGKDLYLKRMPYLSWKEWEKQMKILAAQPGHGDACSFFQ
ncbi:hypothetical protein Taro_016521 [Colocasia esculenta]|uniref:CCHC-type domain-containing protein n=1 Tax=Colocasia esculenta TaxID=4460 RepID=A0A843UKY1_COLES|nr:hypothetical protein [Colocasia esculenta]